MGNTFEKIKKSFSDFWGSIWGFNEDLVIFDCRKFDFYVEGNFEIDRRDVDKIEESGVINKIKFD